MDTHYSTLGVSTSASDSEIKKAYRALSYQYHPDKNGGDKKKEEIYKKINEAYDILKDKTKRQHYDFEINMTQYECRNANINEEMNDIMSHLFGNISKMAKNPRQSKSSRSMEGLSSLFQGGSGISSSMFGDMEEVVFMQMPSPMHPPQSSPMKESENPPIVIAMEDIHMDHSITFEESYHGCCVPIVVERTCEKGNKTSAESETLYVDIPRGIDHNEIITLKEKGHVRNHDKSDLKIHILLQKHAKFERKGMDLLLKREISFKESILGFSFIIEHLNLKNIKFKNSRNKIITNKTSKVIKQLGFVRGENQGDLILEFHVTTPDAFSEEQLKMIEECF